MVFFIFCYCLKNWKRSKQQVTSCAVGLSVNLTHAVKKKYRDNVWTETNGLGLRGRRWKKFYYFWSLFRGSTPLEHRCWSLSSIRIFGTRRYLPTTKLKLKIILEADLVVIISFIFPGTIYISLYYTYYYINFI